METHIDFDCKLCHKHYCCSTCKQNHCRKDLCGKEFTIRLDGFEDNLTYRIYELLWNKVEIELDNGNKIIGTLSFVGFNFIEIHNDEHSNERNHEKGQSLIFTIDKIVKINLVGS